MEAATELFAERGYSGTSVDAIADRAGMTTGALYSNFSGKREVFLSALRTATGRTDDQGDAPAGPEGAAAALPPTQAHMRGAVHFLENLDANPAGFRLLLWAVLEAASDPDVADVLRGVLREQRQAQINYLKTTPHGGMDDWVADNATGLNALAIGIGVQHLVDPQTITTEHTKNVLARTLFLLGQPRTDRSEPTTLELQ
jgi:AcrR family transcriptional regulator